MPDSTDSTLNRRWLTWLLRLGFVAFLAVLFVASAYTAFSLYVRRGGTVLPDVRGRSVAEARQALAAVDVDLAVDPDDARFSAEILEGAVVRQRPLPGATVKRGSVVRVALSRGPELAYLPDYTGEALSVARSRAQADGLPAPVVSWVFEPGQPAGEVVAQYPRPGQRGAANQPVRLFANSVDPETVHLMPDVVYRDVERMRRLFEERGFQVGSIKPDTYRGVPAGTILRQYPLSGYPLTPGDIVAFVVAAGDVDSGDRG